MVGAAFLPRAHPVLSFSRLPPPASRFRPWPSPLSSPRSATNIPDHCRRDALSRLPSIIGRYLVMLLCCLWAVGLLLILSLNLLLSCLCAGGQPHFRAQAVPCFALLKVFAEEVGGTTFFRKRCPRKVSSAPPPPAPLPRRLLSCALVALPPIALNSG